MARLHGTTANIAVPDTDSGDNDQTGLDLHHLLGAIGPYTWTLNTTRDVFDAEAYTDVAIDRIAGLMSWTATTQGRYPGSAPQTGYKSGITFATGNVLHADSFNLTMTAAVSEPLTEFNISTPPDAMEYERGLVEFTGQYTQKVSDTTPLKLGTNSSQSAGSSGDTATFTLSDDTVDNSLAGKLIVEGTNTSAPVNGMVTNTVTFKGSGNVTAAGTNSLFPAGALTKPDVAEVVITAGPGRTYTGNAFWSSVGVTVGVNGLLDVSVTLQGTGTLTPA